MEFIDQSSLVVLCVLYCTILCVSLFLYCFDYRSEFVIDISLLFCNFLFLLSSFLFGYSGGDICASLCTIGGNKSKYKKRGVRRIVSTIDYDPLYNKSLIEKGGSALRRLKGRTIVEFDGTEYSWPFPVFSVKEVNAWLVTANKNDVKYASVDQRVVSRFVRAFGVLNFPYEWASFEYSGVTYSFASLVSTVVKIGFCAGAVVALEGSIFWALISFALILCVSTFNAFVYTRLPLGLAVPLSVLAEELHKEYFGSLGFVEFFDKNSRGSVIVETFSPFFFHTVSYRLTFWWRVFGHCLYNSLVFYLVLRWNSLEDDHIVKRFYSFFWKVIPDRVVSLGVVSLTDFSLGDKVFWVQLLQVSKLASDGLVDHIVACFFTFGWYDKLLKYLEDSLLSLDFLLALVKPMRGSVSFTASGDSKFLSVMSKFLPEFIAKSPSYVALVSFVSCLVGCFAFGSHSDMMEFLPLVDFSALSVKDMAFTAVEASWTIAKSLHKVYLSGNLWDFFQNPRAFTIRMKIVELLERKPENKAEHEVLVQDIDTLMETLAYSSDPYFVNQMTNLVRKKDEFADKVTTTRVIQDVSRFLGRSKDTLEQMRAAVLEAEEWMCNPNLRAKPDLIIKLGEHIRKLQSTIKSVSERSPPFVIVLLGEPGTGKTTVIRQIIESYCAIKGVKYDEAMRADVNVDDKYPLEGRTGNEIFLVMNDLTADHSQDTKSDRKSLGVCFQEIMDTVVLRFKGASIESKAIVYVPEIVFVTTNERSWVFSEKAERLQRRFDEYSIVVDFDVVEGGVKVPHKVFETWPTARRNEALSVKLLRASVNDKTIKFTTTPTSNWCHVSEFYMYLFARFRYKPVRDEMKAGLLKNVCPCGVLYHSHFRKGKFIRLSKELCVERKQEDLVSVPPACICGLPVGHEETPLWDHKRNAEMSSLLDAAQPVRGTPVVTFTSRETNEYFYVMLVLFGSWLVVDKFGAVLSKFVQDLRESGELLLLSGELKATNVVESTLRSFSPSAALRVSRRAAYLRTVRFLKTNSVYLVGSAGILLLWKLFSRASYTAKVITTENVDPDSLRIQSFSQEVNYPAPVREEWNVEERKINSVKLVKVGVSDFDLELSLSSQVLPISVISSTKVAMDGFALQINASWCCTSRHYFYGANGFRRNLLVMKGVTTNIPESDVVTVSSDVVIFRNPVPSPCKDLLSFFSDEIAVSQVEAKVFNSVDSSVRNAVFMPPNFPNCPIPLRDAPNVWMIKKSGPDGECGLPLLCKSTKGYFIGGIVNFRYINLVGQEYQGGLPLTRRDLIKAMESQSEPTISTMVVSSTGADKELDIHSEFRSVSSQFFSVIGSTGATSQKFKSDFRRTDLHDFIIEKGLLSKPYAIPSRVRRVVGEGPDRKYISAFRQTMEGITPNGVIDGSLLTRAVTGYVNHVLVGVEEKFPNLRCSPLTLQESFLGDPRQEVSRCNFLSSVGPEDRVYKDRNGIFHEENVGGDLKYVADPTFVNKLQERLKLLEEGSVMCPWVCGAYKDEIRSLEKLENCEIRLFYTVDLYTNTLARMYLLPLAQVLMKFPEISKCFGKLNSGSREWDRLYHYLKGPSGNRAFMDLDFKKFDISHAYPVIRAVALIFYKLAWKWYGQEVSCRVVYGLVFALTCQLFEHMSDFALKIKGLPSGHIITLILNCLVNVILMMVAYMELLGEEPASFFQKVSAATVGDDNISGVCPSISEKYNLVALQPIYARYGYTVTDALKSARVNPFVEESKAQFVKRKFRFESKVDSYVAPLERDSIFKMLAFWCARKDGGASYTQRMSDVVDVAQREMFLHGKSAFDEFVEMFRPEVERLEWVVHWYTFDELVDKYNSNGQFMFWA